MNRNKQLLKNLMIFFAGSFSSKMLAFLLLPVFTHYLRTEDYGYVDLVFTTVAIAVPCVTLMMPEAIFRFLMEVRETRDQKKVIVSANLYACLSITVFCLLLLLASRFWSAISALAVCYLVSVAFFTQVQQAVRGLGKNVVYSASGLLLTVLQIGLNILFIVVYRMGAAGMIAAALVSYAVASVFLIIVLGRKLIAFDFDFFDFKLLKSMLKYSAPLIPNAVSWWCINYACRYVLFFYCGISGVGLFSVANKFPSMINIANSVFLLAWQESAINEYESQDRDAFYSKIFKALMKFMMSALIVMLPLTKIAMYYMLGAEYQSAWIYTPFLFYGAVFSTFAYFYGTNYICAKKTKAAFTTTVYSAAIAIAACFAFTPVTGINGASVALCISYLSLWLIRHFSMKDIAVIKIDLPWLTGLVAVNALSYLLFMYGSLKVQFITVPAATLVFLLVNIDFVIKLLKKTPVYDRLPFKRILQKVCS